MHARLSLTNDTFTSNSATGGNGGGLGNAGTAMLGYDTFTDNSANSGGGLDNDFLGTVFLTNETFTGNSAIFGGGLANSATATLTDDTFAGNSAQDGAGLANLDMATLIDDTFTGNSASNNGGGLFNVEGATAFLTNDTFTGNSAVAEGGGLVNDDFNHSVTTMYNTIVAGNYVARPPYVNMPGDIAGTVSGSNNLIGDPASDGGLTNGSGGNIVGIAGVSPIALSTIFATDANGVPLLASYGGPTRTVALVPGSPAIDAGSASVPNFQYIDQRGFPIERRADIGAFESQGFQLAIAGGNGQTTPVGQPFASPLTVTVTPINPVEPVNGGTIFFTPQVLGSSPSAILSGFQATIVNGMASVTATANDEPGSYNVAAFGPEATLVEFDLTNEAFTPANIQSAINAAPPGGITLQPTTLTPLNVILTTLAGLGPQASTAKVTVSLPNSMSPYPSVLALLPVGLNFTLNGNGSSVSGNVTIIQLGGSNTIVDNVNMSGGLQILVGYGDPTLDDVNVGGSLLVLIGNGDPVVNNLNVGGDLDVLVGNANNGSVVVAQSKVAGNVQIQAGNGNADQISVSGLTVSGNGNARIETGNGKADAITADALDVGGNLQIETGNGAGDSVAVTADSGPTNITGDTQIQLGNGAGDTATVNGSSGATFDGSFTLQMGNGGNTVNIGTVPGIVTFGGAVQVQFGNGTNTLNLAGTKGGAVPGSQVYFKKQAVFDGRNGKNTRYVGVNVFGGAAVQQLLTVRSAPRAQQTLRRREHRHRLPSPGGRRPSGPNARLATVRGIDHPLRRSRHEPRHSDPRPSPPADPPCPAPRPSPTAADLEPAGRPHAAGRRPADLHRDEPERLGLGLASRRDRQRERRRLFRFGRRHDRFRPFPRGADDRPDHHRRQHRRRELGAGDHGPDRDRRQHGAGPDHRPQQRRGNARLPHLLRRQRRQPHPERPDDLRGPGHLQFWRRRPPQRRHGDADGRHLHRQLRDRRRRPLTTAVRRWRR